jgi:signal transduction histidine kinase
MTPAGSDPSELLGAALAPATRDPDIDGFELLEALNVGVVVRGADGRLRYLNALGSEIVGADPTQVAGTPLGGESWWMVSLDGQPLPRDQRPSAQALATGRPVRNFLLGVVVAGREPRWMFSDAIPRFKDGALVDVVISFREATADSVREHAARIEAETNRRVLQRATEAMPGLLVQFLVARSGAHRLEFVNARLEEHTGVTVDAALRDYQTLARLIHRDDGQALTGLFASDLRWQHELRVRGRGGEWRWHRVHAAPEPHPEGTLWSAVTLDITDQRRVAEQLRHTQLLESMGDLTAGVAHNFNNLLAVIQPSIELCREIAPPSMVQALDDALRASEQAAELVRQLIRMARTEAPRAPTIVDVVPLVRDVIALCRRSFTRRVTIVEEFAVEAARVRISDRDLQQLILNLCLNARDACEAQPQARIEVAVRVGTGHAGAAVELAVSDNGRGVDPGILPRLGEPFFTTKPPGKGTGLGLATGYAIVRDAGGTIEPAARPGGGTTFTIRLPRRDEPPPPRAPTAPIGVATHVLLIDDEAAVRRAMGRALTRHGFVISECEDGEQGLARIASDPTIAAVVLDLSMPGMPGAEVLRRIRARTLALPVLILSGYVADADALTGATAILAKPIQGSTLIDALRAALAARAPA